MADPWWNRLWPKRRPVRAEERPGRRLGFDVLENRINPVLFQVNVTYDALVPINPGDVTLRSAINAANATAVADTIEFVGPAAGANIALSNLAPVVTLTGVSYFAINNPLTINGFTGSGNTTISGAGFGNGRLFTLENAATSNLTLQNTSISDFGFINNGGAVILANGTLNATSVTFSNNRTGGSGGAIALQGGTHNLSSVVFSSNRADFHGGGLFLAAGGNTSNVQFQNNSAGSRGGGVLIEVVSGGFDFGASSGNSAAAGGLVAVDNNSTITFDNEIFELNNATNGGAIAVGFLGVSATVNLNNSIVRNNTATSTGGGVAIAGSGSLFSNNTVFGGSTTAAGNTAPSGAAIFSSGGGALRQVTIAGNTTTANPAFAMNAGLFSIANSTISTNPGIGGLFISAGLLVLANNTVTLNGNIGIQQAGGSVSMGNTIVANNTGVDYLGSFSSVGNNLIGNTTGIVSGPIASDLVNVNPLLGPLAANGAVFPSFTHALLPGSPALNAGNNATAASLTIDQRGSTRFFQTVDIGAYELVDTVAPTGALTPAPPNITVAQAGANTLLVTVAYTDTAGGGFESPSGVNPATFGTNDITVNNGATVTAFSVNGNQVTYTITAPAATWGASPQGTYTISLTAAGVTDRVNNPIAGVANFGTFIVDTVRPTASLTTPPVNINANSNQTQPNQFVVTFSEPVTGFANAFTVNNGGTVTFLMMMGNVATYQISPPGGTWDNSPQGTYTISFVAGSVADQVGNTNLGVANFASFMVNTIRPFATLTTPAPNITVANATPGTNSFTITYSTLGAPLDPSSFGSNDVTVTNDTNMTTLSVISVMAAGNAVTYTVQAAGGMWSTLPQSGYTIALNGNSVFDTAGNAVLANPTLGFFFVDVCRPTAALTTPAADINTNSGGGPTNTVVITYSDIGQGVNTSTFGTGNITVTGPMTLTVGSAMASGNVVTYTILAPGGDWANAPAGTYTIGIVGDNVKDNAGNGITANANFDFFIVDLTRPTATLTTPPPNINAANAGPGQNSFTITYADTGSGVNPATFATSNVTVTNGSTTLTVTGVSAMGNAVTYTVAPPGNNWNNVPSGTYTVALVANSVQDNAGNGVLGNANIASFTVDVSNPTVVVSPTGINSNASPINFTLTFSEPVTGLTTAGITVTGGTAGTLIANSSSVYTLPVTPTADGPVTVTVNAGAAQDASGNPNTVSNTAVVQSDRTGPVATFSQPSSLTTVSGPISYTVTWTDTNFSAVTLTPGQVIINGTGTAGAANVAVTGTGNTRTITLSNIFGNGTISISLPPGVAVDTLGNPSAAAGPSPSFTVSGTRVLSIAQSTPPVSVLPGTTYVSTILYGNTGTQPSPNTTISVSLSGGTFAPAASTPGWTGSGSTFTYSLGTLAPGTTGQLAFGVSFAAKTPPGTRATIAATIKNSIGDSATSTVSFLVVDANRLRWGRCC